MGSFSGDIAFPGQLGRDVFFFSGIFFVGGEQNFHQPLHVPLMLQKSGEKTTWDVKGPVNNGMNYQPQLLIAGFLIHQQFHCQNPNGFNWASVQGLVEARRFRTFSNHHHFLGSSPAVRFCGGCNHCHIFMGTQGTPPKATPPNK